MKAPYIWYETGKSLSDKHTEDSVDAYFDLAVKNEFFLPLVTWDIIEVNDV